MQVGQLVADRYKIISVIGEGGMANVYLAEDTFLHREVAIKALRMDLRNDSSILERFKREAISTSELSHPNIVNVLDVGVDQGTQFMVIEYIKGKTLKTYIRDNFPIPYQRVIDMMEQILSAVKIAHEHNIVHRDLKPENIMVDHYGRVKVSDFGIALALSEQPITQTNTTLGSVYYMSPEQTRGKKATTKSDIYSLGIILYEMLTKNVPFTGDSSVAIALKHFRTPMPFARDVDPRIPQALENVILKATAKDPNQRYQTADEMAKDLKTTLLSTRAGEQRFVPLDESLEETKVMEPINSKASDKPKKKKWWTKKKIAIASIIGILLIIILGAVWTDSNQKVNVPDVSDLTRTQAEDVLESKGLKVGDIYKVYSNSVKEGHIIKSQPEINSKVKKGSQVDLQISRGQKKYQLEDYTEKKYSTISSDLSKKGFTIKKTSEYSSSVPKGYIISQSVPAGEKVVPNNTTIEFEVSKGEKDKKIAVRDLSQYTLKSAQDYANEQGFVLSSSEEYSDTVAQGLVISQNPAAGAYLIKGDKLSVVISKGKDPAKQFDTFTKNIQIPFDSSKDQNEIQIFIGDVDHDIEGAPAQTFTITSNKNVELSFKVKTGQTGNYLVKRDGQVIMNEVVKK
ncbi:Stk1 family PASTA domain-containing Ser/Thr kinase [Companilactobacillus sp. DQM5]|uniref:Stk1 family PASTA domain-containing Ser/Thr kinase n=1 Tax=Companilactobacillus sp. DQM5 TaxID=3463359 RepID=UPI004059B1C5